MSDEKYWLLPDGINEALPDEAEHLDNISRRVIDHFKGYGYRQVMPPLVEFLESLHTGTGSGLQQQMFKVTDLISGKMMGIRADMTPQVARIDAHSLSANLLEGQPNRLCYMGNVLRTRSNHLLQGNRSPIQVGAELFGHDGIESDSEIITMMLDMIRLCGNQPLVLSLGHVGIYRAVIAYAGLDEQQSANYQSMLLRKSLPEIEDWLKEDLAHCNERQQHMLRTLPTLTGKPSDVLTEARSAFAGIGEAITEQLDYIEQLVKRIADYDNNMTAYLDLSEIRGYEYHTGIVFEAYVKDGRRDIARGGRYNGVGRLFGNDRPATGFSADLKSIAELALSDDVVSQEADMILAPNQHDPDLQAYIKVLRSQGECVMNALGHESDEMLQRLGCKRQLVKENNQWVVVSRTLSTMK